MPKNKALLSPFVNDPFALTCMAFGKLYPNTKCECWIDVKPNDWADSTWNPVTGCLHGCPYCYARRIALRFSSEEGRAMGESGILVELETPKRADQRKILPYPYGFAPTFHKYKLDVPRHWRKPRRIFCLLHGGLV